MSIRAHIADARPPRGMSRRAEAQAAAAEGYDLRRAVTALRRPGARRDQGNFNCDGVTTRSITSPRAATRAGGRSGLLRSRTWIIA